MNEYQRAWLNIIELAHKGGTVKEEDQELMEQLVYKATPKRVIVSKPSKYEFGTVACPTCGASIHPWSRRRRCRVCDQTLKWGSDEDE